MPNHTSDETPTLRLVSIGPFVPYPRIPHAGGQFLHAHLSALGSACEVTLVAPGTPVNLEALPQAPEQIRVHCTPLGSVTRQAVRRLTHYPINVRTGLTPGAGMLAAARRDPVLWEAVRNSDVVEIQWAQWLPLVDDLRRRAPHVAIVAVEHDVFTCSLKRRLAHSRSWRIRETSRIRLRRAPTLERNLLNRCDAILVFSHNDEALLRELGVRVRIEVIPPHVNWPASPTGPAEQPVVLFVGAMGRPENSEAALDFLARCWPTVRASVPGAQLRVVGHAPPRALLAHRDPSVAVTGFVEDLEPEYQRARVVIAPGRSSAGVNFKVVQAMAHALPVVASAESAEGIVEIVGPDAFQWIGTDAASMAAAVIEALRPGSHPGEVGRRAEQRLRAWRAQQQRDPLVQSYREMARQRMTDSPRRR